MTIKETLLTWSRSTFAHVAFSFVMMGGWAVFANAAHPMPKPLIAGFLQGALSGLITLGMKKALEALFAFWCQRGRPNTGLVATPLMVCSVSATSLLICHALAGTPELIATIIVPSSVAVFYAYVYTFSLWKFRGDEQAATETEQ